MDRGKRGTGRTTRLIEYAKQLAKHGHRVNVYVATVAEVQRFRLVLGKISNIKIKIFCLEMDNGNLRYTTDRFEVLDERDVHCVIDHYAIEYTFAGILREMVIYDAE